jgi:hypothetical protein
LSLSGKFPVKTLSDLRRTFSVVLGRKYRVFGSVFVRIVSVDEKLIAEETVQFLRLEDSFFHVTCGTPALLRM